MTRPARRRFVATIVAIAFALSGCDLMVATVTPQPSRLSRTPAPLPTAEPDSTDEVPTPQSQASAGPSFLGDAADRLADLGSYRVGVSSRGLVPATAADGIVRMSSTLVQGEEPAVRFSIAGLDGIPGGHLEAIVIGDEAWVRDAGGRWMKSPGGAADFDSAFTALSPIDLASEFDGLDAVLTPVATERRNGIASRHLRATASAAAAAGLSEGSADVWLAVRGGFLVAFAVEGTWNLDGTPTAVSLRIDVSHVNDRANVVRRPG